MRPLNLKFKAWVELSKEMGLIDGHADLTHILLGRTGKPVSNAHISNMVRGVTAIAEKHFRTISNTYTYTPVTFFIGDDDIVIIQDLLSYIAEKEGVFKKDLTSGDHVAIASYNNSTDDFKWQDVFDEINSKYGYRLKISLIRSKGVLFKSGKNNRFEGKTLQVKSLYRVLDICLERKIVDSKRDFAINILECNPNLIYNMLLPNIAQDVTKDMLVGLAKNLKTANLRYILLGEGEAFTNSASDKIHLLQEQIDALRENLK